MRIAIVCIGFWLLSGCSRSDQAEAHRQTEEIRREAKRTYKEADEAVTRELKKAREEVHREAAEAKKRKEEREEKK